MTPNDLKTYGLPMPNARRPMPAALVTLCRALVAIIAVLTAYSLVADAPDRLVIMSRADFERRIAAERIAAARQTLEAMECPAPSWRGMFRQQRPTPINPM